MALLHYHRRRLASLLAFAAACWFVAFVGLAFLHRSCAVDDMPTATDPDWEAEAQLPTAEKCFVVYRWMWWSVVAQIASLTLIAATLPDASEPSLDLLNRWRYALLGLQAVVTTLQMWSANITLNLTDTTPAALESTTVRVRAFVTFLGFALTCIADLLIIALLGQDPDFLEEPGSREGRAELSTAAAERQR